MWDLYRQYEQEFENHTVFDPTAALLSSAQPPPPAPQQIPMPVPLGHSIIVELKLACVESAVLSSWCRLKRRYTFVNLNAPSGDAFIREENLVAPKWDHQPMP
jgi:hypothetical protein